MKKLPARAIYPIGISILFGCLFWVMDGVIHFYFFSDFIRLLIVEGPETLMESIILKVPAHSLIVRVSFLVMSLAGGLMGALAASGSTDKETIRQAMVYGSITASFGVEEFSLERLKRLSREEIENRVAKFKRMFIL